MTYTKFNLNSISVLINNRVEQDIFLRMGLQPLRVNIPSFKSPINSGKSANNTGLNSFKIIVRKNSYYEEAFSFGSTATVTDIQGLPQGMIYELGCFKGSPQLDGEYTVIIRLSDGSTITGAIIVPQLPRLL
jgi:hypothetical protein